MGSNGLTGTLPAGIADMLSLNTLDLHNSDISVGIIFCLQSIYRYQLQSPQ